MLAAKTNKAHVHLGLNYNKYKNKNVRKAIKVAKIKSEIP